MSWLNYHLILCTSIQLPAIIKLVNELNIFNFDYEAILKNVFVCRAPTHQFQFG